MPEASVKFAIWMLIVGGVLEFALPTRAWVDAHRRSSRARSVALRFARWLPRIAYGCGLTALVGGVALVAPNLSEPTDPWRDSCHAPARGFCPSHGKQGADGLPATGRPWLGGLLRRETILPFFCPLLASWSRSGSCRDEDHADERAAPRAVMCR